MECVGLKGGGGEECLINEGGATKCCSTCVP